MNTQKLKKLAFPFLAGAVAFVLTGCDDESALVETVMISSPSWSIGKYEVTQAQYAAVMGKSSFRECLIEDLLNEREPMSKDERTKYEARLNEEMSHVTKYFGDNKPVFSVSWDCAMMYCEKLTEQEKKAGRLPAGYRYTLPTSKQWEIACRAGTKTRFCSGDTEDDLSRVAWWEKNSEENTHPVGTKEPNAWGIYDMHGNVREWCLDELNSKRIRRGSSYRDDTRRSESSYVFELTSSDRRNPDLGFRVALVPVSQ